jgi:hypothetical protein
MPMVSSNANGNGKAKVPPAFEHRMDVVRLDSSQYPPAVIALRFALRLLAGIEPGHGRWIVDINL